MNTRLRSPLALLMFIQGAVAMVLPTLAHAETTFRQEVMAVLSKAGCNLGTCHGNLNGKGGFKLSLRGESPAADYLALTRDQLGRRINRHQPELSLLLRKATGQVAHQGGQRFAPDDPLARLLRDWVASGARDSQPATARLVGLEVSPTTAVVTQPETSVRLTARARFADGSSAPVQHLAVFEATDQTVTISPQGTVQATQPGETTVLVRFLDQRVPVRLAFIPARPDFVWNHPAENNFIDRLVFAKLRALKIAPTEICDDALFIRRVYLDLLGLLPSANEARAFMAEKTPDKRQRLVNSLLERDEFADFWALKWSDLLRIEEKVLDRKGVRVFHAWIREGIKRNKPWDQFARELVAARGSTYQHPPANYYRANRDPVTRGETTAQVFLGTRLQCAKCHNHPFERWSQDDYYRWAAAFARVDYNIVENKRKDKNDSHEFDGEQIVFLNPKKQLVDPRTGGVAPAHILGNHEALNEQRDPLEQVAEWLTHPANSLFARTQANRVWFHLLGRGIVDPIDDFRATNPPVHPPLLEALAAEFVQHQYDIRHLIRVITSSRVYQLSSVPTSRDSDDELNFARGSIRRLTAEQLLDALAQVADRPVLFSGEPEGTRAGQLPGTQVVTSRNGQSTPGDRFLLTFGKPPRLLACDCERSSEVSLGQSFVMISGPLVDDLLTHPQNRLTRLLDAKQSDSATIEELYWTALTRAPSDREREFAQLLLRKTNNRRAALEDIVWGLINSKEFLFRR